MSDLDISVYPGAIRVDESAPHPRVARFDRNSRGRDFVVGDIHGMFDHLQQLLDELSFDPDRDRLFSVGDLVDRGPLSRLALRWLEQPWFHACRGNHEQFALESDDKEQLDLWVNYNGGEWWLDLEQAEQQALLEAFAAMPLALEVQTDTGLVGIVHADVPPHTTWDEFTDRLQAGDEDALFYALWSRTRVSGEFAEPVAGEPERIYCGHTPTSQTVQVGNVWFIDTGAVYSYEGYKQARLTLVEVQPRSHVEHDIRTADRRDY